MLPDYDFAVCDGYVGPVFQDESMLVIDRARYTGETAAAVIAMSERVAKTSLRCLDVKLYHCRP